MLVDSGFSKKLQKKTPFECFDSFEDKPRGGKKEQASPTFDIHIRGTSLQLPMLACTLWLSVHKVRRFLKKSGVKNIDQKKLFKAH